jgi:hypothetical protein
VGHQTIFIELEVDHEKYYSDTKIVRMGVDINLNKTLKVEKELISVARRVITQLQNADSSKKRRLSDCMNKRNNFPMPIPFQARSNIVPCKKK